MLKTCLGCGATYAATLAQCPHDGVTDYLESGETVTITDTVSTATSGTLTVGHAAQVDATAADCTRTLPDASDSGAAKAVIVRKVDSTAHTVTITPASGDTVDSGSTYVLSSAGAGVLLRSDGTSNWLPYALAAPDPLLASIYLTRAEAGSAGAAMAIVLDS